MPQQTYALDTIDGLVGLELRAASLRVSIFELRSGRMHCTTCSREMTMIVHALRSTAAGAVYSYRAVVASRRDVGRRLQAPSLFRYTCVECRSQWTTLVYKGPHGASLAVFGESLGGLSTPNTPEAVAYYLGQAYKSQAASANTAAIAMYRAALEHLLFEQGYTTRELGPKLGALDRDVTAGKGPPWAHRLNLAFLKVLKDLGNYSIHPNDGDVAGQERFGLRRACHSSRAAPSAARRAGAATR